VVPDTATGSGSTPQLLRGFFPEGAPEVIVDAGTVLFLVCLINAVNLIDGLDGLAVTCCLVTLGGFFVLCLLLDGGISRSPPLLIAVFGSLVGFFRHNMYPARVFMGDAGSQFLGLCLGVLSLELLEAHAPQLSPTSILLLIGLPVLDMLAVMQHRLRHGRSPFAADRNHLHHRLLDLGVTHPKAVLAVAFGQVALVVGALYFEQDRHVLLLSCAACVLLGLRFVARVHRAEVRL
jgi:UDP-GlcNAc:undecaprenyl-phosphate GlcNAc-1-phosphate transferase